MIVGRLLASCIFRWACRGTACCGPNSKQRSGLCSRDKEGVWFLTQPSGRGARDFTARAKQDAGLECWNACSWLTRKIPWKKKEQRGKFPLQVRMHSSATRKPDTSWLSLRFSLNKPAQFVWGRILSCVRRQLPCVVTVAVWGAELIKHRTCTRQTVFTDRNL